MMSLRPFVSLSRSPFVLAAGVRLVLLSGSASVLLPVPARAFTPVYTSGMETIMDALIAAKGAALGAAPEAIAATETAMGVAAQTSAVGAGASLTGSGAASWLGLTASLAFPEVGAAAVLGLAVGGAYEYYFDSNGNVTDTKPSASSTSGVTPAPAPSGNAVISYWFGVSGLAYNASDGGEGQAIAAGFLRNWYASSTGAYPVSITSYNCTNTTAYDSRANPNCGGTAAQCSPAYVSQIACYVNYSYVQSGTTHTGQSSSQYTMKSMLADDPNYGTQSNPGYQQSETCGKAVAYAANPCGDDPYADQVYKPGVYFPPYQQSLTIPDADSNLQVDPTSLARLSNELWRQAAAQSNYQGIPYSTSNPIMPADVQNMMQSGQYPTMADLASPMANPRTGDIQFAPAPVSSTTGSQSGTGTSSGTSTGSGTGTGSPSGGLSCGLPSQPPCEIDWGPADQTPKPSDEQIPTMTQILDPLFNAFPALSKWQQPGHAGVCPTDTLSVFGKTFTLDQHCAIFEQYRPQIGVAAMACWTLLALFIVLGA